MGLSIVNIFSDFILIPNHPRINYIFIGKMICTHVKLYMNPFYGINLSRNNDTMFQQICFATICNQRCSNYCSSNKPCGYKCSKANLLIGDRN